jgi:hypothetical protein
MGTETHEDLTKLVKIMNVQEFSELKLNSANRILNNISEWIDNNHESRKLGAAILFDLMHRFRDIFSSRKNKSCLLHIDTVLQKLSRSMRDEILEGSTEISKHDLSVLIQFVHDEITHFQS